MRGNAFQTFPAKGLRIARLLTPKSWPLRWSSKCFWIFLDGFLYFSIVYQCSWRASQNVRKTWQGARGPGKARDHSLHLTPHGIWPARQALFMKVGIGHCQPLLVADCLNNACSSHAFVGGSGNDSLSANAFACL